VLSLIGFIFILSCTTKTNYLVKYHEKYGRKYVYSKSNIFYAASIIPTSIKNNNTNVVKFMWPLNGKLSSQYGFRNGKMHHGIDISVPEGTPVKAAFDGKVLYSDNKVRGYGNLIIIKHENSSYVSVYAHNQKNLVREGSNVKKGDVIAYVGRTGKITGSHLHFEIREGKKSVDPLVFLR
jgi:murein DD-endopeptidase MepM/ murein hydrolase activator NlpD